MATTVVLTGVVKEQAPSTVVRVRFGDGTELEFNDFAALVQWSTGADSDVILTRQLCVAYALARSEDLTNIASVSNKNFIFDLTNNNPIRVQ